MNTGDVIKYLRKKNNLTQEELANMLGTQKSSVQKYENGKVQNLKLDIIQKLCKIFDITPMAFIFPGAWQEVHMEKDGKNKFFECSKIYFCLTDEGKEKVLEYIKDLGEIEKYKKQNDVF